MVVFFFFFFLAAAWAWPSPPLTSGSAVVLKSPRSEAIETVAMSLRGSENMLVLGVGCASTFDAPGKGFVTRG